MGNRRRRGLLLDLHVWWRLHSGAMEEDQMRNSKRAGRLAGVSPVLVAEGMRHLPGLVFLDSAGFHPRAGSSPVSWIGVCPREVHRGSIHSSGDRERLRKVLSAGAERGDGSGGLCGWVDYEGGFVFGEYDGFLSYHHGSGEWFGGGGFPDGLGGHPEEPVEIGVFRQLTSRGDFLEGVARAKEWIAAGDIYQVNLSQAFEAGVSGGSLFGLYQSLRHASPAPMAAWMSLDGREVLSSSPETFLTVQGRMIETRPIKGTSARHEDPDLDRESATALRASVKETAELVMITDLLRNDLGQVCDFGSVTVDGLLELESLAQVHHLVSTVRGELRPEVDALDALAACFPGGSITGAPKIRAMEIIREIETRPRGIYCGALGRIGFRGDAVFNIAIRTMVRDGSRLTYHVGAGIVADSDPRMEYEETLHKAAGIRLAVERWRSENEKKK